MKIEFIQEIIDLIRRKYSFQEIKLKKMLNKNSDDFINIKFVYDFISKNMYKVVKIQPENNNCCPFEIVRIK